MILLKDARPSAALENPRVSGASFEKMANYRKGGKENQT
jgi:hypothetical protein